MNSDSAIPNAPLATLVALVPEMSPDAPKRNLVVTALYALLLWVTGARLLSALSAV
jgi:hypothetical protein